MKKYEIVRQGSRFVVRTHEDDDGSIVTSAPFHTHAAAQGYIDQLRAISVDTVHNERDKTDNTITNTKSNESLESEYGLTIYEGKQYTLTGKPIFAGVYGLGISADNFSASCIDENGKKYTAYFEVLERDADNGVFADWENASLIERV